MLNMWRGSSFHKQKSKQYFLAEMLVEKRLIEKTAINQAQGKFSSTYSKEQSHMKWIWQLGLLKEKDPVFEQKRCDVCEFSCYTLQLSHTYVS